MTQFQVGKKEISQEVLGAGAPPAQDQWRPGQAGGPGGEPGAGDLPGGGEDISQGEALTSAEINANRKLVKGTYTGLVALARVMLKLPEGFKALPEEVDALQDAWETLIPPGYEMPKALIVTATILGEKAAQAMALRKDQVKEPAEKSANGAQDGDAAEKAGSQP